MNRPENLTILIIDDEYLVRVGIRETINWEAYNFRISGEASNGEEGLALAKTQKPERNHVGRVGDGKGNTEV